MNHEGHGEHGLDGDNLRDEISAFDPGLRIMWTGQLVAGGPLEAIIENPWGQWLWSFYRDQAVVVLREAFMPSSGVNQLSLF